jgi:hypothetical protein
MRRLRRIALILRRRARSIKRFLGNFLAELAGLIEEWVGVERVAIVADIQIRIIFVEVFGPGGGNRK